jgi:signal transduction histidine kinase
MSQTPPLVESFPDVTPSTVARLLVESSKRFARALDRSKIFEELEYVIRTTMPADGMLVSSFDSSTQLITCSYAWIGGERPDVSGFPPLALETKPGTGMQSEVIRTGQARIFGDVQERVEQGKGTYYDVNKSGKVSDLPKGSRPSTSSAVMVPIKLDDEVIGVLQVMSETSAAYSETHLTLLEGLAWQVAAAEKNAALFEKMQTEISERIRAESSLREREEEIRELNAQLEKRVVERTAQLEKAKNDMEGFCYSVSHDLRQPLRGICGAAAMLMQDYAEQLSDEARKDLKTISAASNRMSKLIDDLLSFSRLGRGEMHVAEVDLSALAEMILSNQREVRYQIQPGLRANGDPLMLQVALENLLDNAFKFSTGIPDALIEFGREGDAFFVRDNGVGFEQQYVEKIFLPFERLHREDEFPGTGIGLANVKRIVERHGGRIWAQGELGYGATFYFTLGD